ncbi:MAG: ribosome maturation factor RimM [Acaryochloridaceae cyanobacterium SU_2_1]|nr:ribosome maturation factor RimM [Acaryochloridaceae cyanobacterium SU_2_1]NJM95401.1 ribosome maturation factor RimM [Acaryochloridaceae cyanobacterium CSU_5_19]
MSPETELVDPWLAVGRIVGAHGLEGDVKVYPDSDFPERFEQPGQRWLRSGQNESNPQPVQLLKGRFIRQKGLYVVSFVGVNSRYQAEELRGKIMLVRSCDRPSLAEGEYYLSDLIGLSVIHQQSRKALGTVVRIASAGNDLLEIELLDPPKMTVLVPFVTEIVPKIDLLNQNIEISPPLGLLP